MHALFLSRHEDRFAKFAKQWPFESTHIHVHQLASNSTQQYAHPDILRAYEHRVAKYGWNGRVKPSKFTVSCSNTHMRTWRHIAEHLTEAIVFEDDAITEFPIGLTIAFINSSRHLQWDHLNLGPCWDFCSTRRPVAHFGKRREFTVYQSLSACCTHAYVMSKRGATTMLQHSRAYVTSVDLLLSWAHRSQLIRSFSVAPRLWEQRKTRNRVHDRRPLVHCDAKEGWYWPTIVHPCTYIRGRRCRNVILSGRYQDGDRAMLDVVRQPT